MGTTIKDIAQRADVSPATVSLVLNRKRGVGGTLIERDSVARIGEPVQTTFHAPDKNIQFMTSTEEQL